MGNRGCLHDEHQHLHRQFVGRRWIYCLLEFKGRHREIMSPGRYTELFFLDEATALAAGHRPCAECQPERYYRYREAFRESQNLAHWLSADEMDRILHESRLQSDKSQRTYPARLEELPSGVFVQQNETTYLFKNRELFEWKPEGYLASLKVPLDTEVIRQFLAERPARISVQIHQGTDFIVAKSIHMEFLHIVDGTIDHKLSHILVPEGEREASGPSPIGKVETVIVVPVRRAIPEVQARIVTLEPASVVVHDIKDHRDSVQMTEVNHRLELMRPAAEVFEREWGVLLGREQSIHRDEIARQGGLIVDHIAEVGREIIASVVPHTECRFALVDRERLQHVDTQRLQVLDLPDHIEKGGLRARCPGGERADVELVHDHV